MKVKKVTRVIEQPFSLGRWSQRDIVELVHLFGDNEGEGDFGAFYRVDMETTGNRAARREADLGMLECLRDLRKAVKAAGGTLYLIVREET